MGLLKKLLLLAGIVLPAIFLWNILSSVKYLYDAVSSTAKKPPTVSLEVSKQENAVDADQVINRENPHPVTLSIPSEKVIIANTPENMERDRNDDVIKEGNPLSSRDGLELARKDKQQISWNTQYRGERRREKRAIKEKYRGKQRPPGPWKKIALKEAARAKSEHTPPVENSHQPTREAIPNGP